MWWYFFILLYCSTIFIVGSIIGFSSYLKEVDKIIECLVLESRRKRSFFYEITENNKDYKSEWGSFWNKIFKQSYYQGRAIFNKIEYLKKFFYEYKRGLKEKIIFIESVKKKIYLSIIGCLGIRIFFTYGMKEFSSSTSIRYSIGGWEDLGLNVFGTGIVIILAVIMNINFNRKIILSKNNKKKIEGIIKYYMDEANDLEKGLILSFKDLDDKILDDKDMFDLDSKEFSKSLASNLSFLKIKQIKEGISYTKEIERYLEDKLEEFLYKEKSNFLNFIEIFPILELFFLGGSIFFFLAIPIFSII